MHWMQQPERDDHIPLALLLIVLHLHLMINLPIRLQPVLQHLIAEDLNRVAGLVPDDIVGDELDGLVAGGVVVGEAVLEDF